MIVIDCWIVCPPCVPETVIVVAATSESSGVPEIVYVERVPAPPSLLSEHVIQDAHPENVKVIAPSLSTHPPSESYATSSVAVEEGSVTGVGVPNLLSGTSSKAVALALPLSTIWLATSSNASPPARNRARFLRSFVVTVFLFSRLSVESGMAATMFGSTSILHLEGCGNHPIG